MHGRDDAHIAVMNPRIVVGRARGMGLVTNGAVVLTVTVRVLCVHLIAQVKQALCERQLIGLPYLRSGGTLT